jgi:hypothetical protein
MTHTISTTRLLRLLIATLSVGAALAFAQAAPAALSWGGAGSVDAAGAACIPCFPLNVIVQGTGRVNGVDVDGNAVGQIVCPTGTGTDGYSYDCNAYFLFPEGRAEVILTPTPDSGQTFLGWTAGNEASEPGCPLYDPGPTQCHLTQENVGYGLCLIAHFTPDTGTVGTCAPDPPPSCSPNCVDVYPPNPPPAPPPPPPPPKCVVPRVVGKTLAAAKIAIRAKHCRLGLITRVASKRIAKGRVVSTTPRGGVVRPNGTRVKIAVSRGRV